MVDNNIEELIELNRRLIDETCCLKKELVRIRSKLETTLYKVATKYEVLNNDILTVKNKYRGSTKSYIAPKNNSGFVDWR
tara:strand:- start:2840 stop:3079 length:240 start_codon:yes stop_codon:yes gene_type:complete